MITKLRCVAVDDDPMMLEMVRDLCKDSAIVEITNAFESPKTFLESARFLKFDFCLLDIFMPELDGITLAKMFSSKPIIFMTGDYSALKDALDMAPVDVLPKPIMQDRLFKSFEKMYRYVTVKESVKSHELFRVAEASDKLNIRLNEIIFVRSDEADPRNKIVLRTGESFTLMECTFERLLDRVPTLVKVNRTHLISLEAVQHVRHDLITLKNIKGVASAQITLSDTCRKNFIERMSSY